MHKGLGQGYFPQKPFLVIPGRVTIGEDNRFIQNHVGREIPLLERRGVDERLESGTGLASALDGAVVLAVIGVVVVREMLRVGRKAIACSLSDCAAMAVRPVAAVASVALPASATMAFAQALFAGMKRAAASFGPDRPGPQQRSTRCRFPLRSGPPGPPARAVTARFGTRSTSRGRCARC